MTPKYDTCDHCGKHPIEITWDFTAFERQRDPYGKPMTYNPRRRMTLHFCEQCGRDMLSFFETIKKGSERR